MTSLGKLLINHQSSITNKLSEDQVKLKCYVKKADYEGVSLYQPNCLTGNKGLLHIRIFPIQCSEYSPAGELKAVKNKSGINYDIFIINTNELH